MTTLRLIEPHKTRRQAVRKSLAEGVRALRNDDTLAGYVLVGWDHRGAATTIYSTAEGPISRCLMPTYVSDVLARHIGLDMAREEIK